MPPGALICNGPERPWCGHQVPEHLFGGTAAGPASNNRHLTGGLLMNTDVMFLDCPAYMDKRGAARCGLPAEVEDRYTVRSSDGPMESAKIRCPRGHWFNSPVEFLTWDKQAGAAAPQGAGPRRQDAASPPARRPAAD
jgi:hypothetical protein